MWAWLPPRYVDTVPGLMAIAVLLPGVLLLNVACAISIRAHPEFFLKQHGHIWLVAAQIIGFLGYLIYVVRFYATLAPLIAQARHEWHESVD